MARVRPSRNGYLSNVDVNSDSNDIKITEIKKNLQNKVIKSYKNYTFDKVFDDEYTNDDLFNDFGMEIALNLIKKIDTTFYVYGQTGSGKTYTIMGTDRIPGLLVLLLRMIKSYNNINLTFNCIQIYNNKCYDILNNNNEIYEREDSNNKIHLTNVKSINLSKENVQNIINIIKKNRMVGISNQNDASSRSHLIFQINNESSFLKILDLAGSEKAKDSVYINKKIFRENAEINKSILVLKECIRALKFNKSYVPYRGSKLTKILKDSFERKSESYILATVSPELENVSDSINTLNYISDIRLIKREVIESRVKENNNKLMLPKINTGKKSPYRRLMKHNSELSPNFRLIVNNRFSLDSLYKKQSRLFNYVSNNRSSKKYKHQIQQVIDDEIKALQNIKKKII
jgi:kinesin family protein 2/24